MLQCFTGSQYEFEWPPDLFSLIMLVLLCSAASGSEIINPNDNHQGSHANELRIQKFERRSVQTGSMNNSLLHAHVDHLHVIER